MPDRAGEVALDAPPVFAISWDLEISGRRRRQGEGNLMSIHDRKEPGADLDPHSMISLVEAFPEHVAAAAAAAGRLSLPAGPQPEAVVVSGLGGSAIAGDLAYSIAGARMEVPFVVSRDYVLPAFVGPRTLVVASSYSGDTEETLGAYAQARRAGARIVCISSGGELSRRAESDGVARLPLPGGFPPRAALGHALMTLLGALGALRVIPPPDGALEETLEVLAGLRDECGAGAAAGSNPARGLARSLAGKIVAIYGSSGVMGACAYRWRSQIEENAKQLAFHHVLPEMNHNELVGWRFPEGVLGEVGAVFLRDRGDHPQVQRRFELTRGVIGPVAGGLHEVWSRGESLLCRVLSSLYLGDFVSLYMAYLNRVDPTPVSVIDTFKRALGEDPNSRAVE